MQTFREHPDPAPDIPGNSARSWKVAIAVFVLKVIEDFWPRSFVQVLRFGGFRCGF